MSDESVLILAGATASGKTELAIELARTFDAEIVGADSRQIYRGMPIGTAMPSPEQLAVVPHHLFGFLDPHERYSAARYAADAVEAIEGIHRRGKHAIVVGGTGFYIRALMGAIELAPQYDESLRERLAHEARLHPPDFLHTWLSHHDRARAAALAPNDTYRVLRALEIALAEPTAKPSFDSAQDDKAQHDKAQAQHDKAQAQHDKAQAQDDMRQARVDVTGCHPERSRRMTRRNLELADIASMLVFLDVALDELDERIARRTRRMLDTGLVDEAERIGSQAVAASAVGYPQALAYVRGWSTPAELRDSLERATRRYARRQRTWFRSERDAHWLAPGAVDAVVREKLGWAAKPQ